MTQSLPLPVLFSVRSGGSHTLLWPAGWLGVPAWSSPCAFIRLICILHLHYMHTSHHLHTAVH